MMEYWLAGFLDCGNGGVWVRTKPIASMLSCGRAEVRVMQAQKSARALNGSRGMMIWSGNLVYHKVMQVLLVSGKKDLDNLLINRLDYVAVLRLDLYTSTMSWLPGPQYLILFLG